jgi:predicted class III extradiol MEMO1 family dioxygenase
MEHKTCKKCKQDKTLAHFNKKYKDQEKYHARCKQCLAEDFKERYTSEDIRRWQLKKHYNMTIEQYTQMVEQQDHRCKVCERHEQDLNNILCVDHDHKTGKVRSLLCSNCNTVLGKVYEDPKILEKMIEYLNEHKQG